MMSAVEMLADSLAPHGVLRARPLHRRRTGDQLIAARATGGLAAERRASAIIAGVASSFGGGPVPGHVVSPSVK